MKHVRTYEKRKKKALENHERRGKKSKPAEPCKVPKKNKSVGERERKKEKRKKKGVELRDFTIGDKR